MSAPDLAFYFFAILTVVCGALVIVNPFTRSPVTSAMFLVSTIVAMSGLFLTLHAYFLAAVQVLVYAGAVMVLFLFVIMLLDLKEEQRRQVKWGMLGSGLVAVMMMVLVLSGALRESTRLAAAGNGDKLPAPNMEGTTQALGNLLFRDFVLPFEVLSLLLLVAMIGAILLSKKEVK